MSFAAELCCFCNDCHPEGSMAVSRANRQTQSKDPYHLQATCGLARNSVRVALVLVLPVASVLAGSAQTFRNFPGRKSELVSPNGRYLIQNMGSDKEPDDHEFLLKDKSTGTLREAYKYETGASVVWSPDSRHFAINDSAGSDYTETKILSVDESVPEIDVQKEIRSKLDVPAGHHEYSYVACQGVIYHSGYGGELPNGFCECYVYRLNGPVRKCARQPGDSDSVCERTIP